MLANSITLQFLQAISRRYEKFAQIGCSVKHEELSIASPPNVIRKLAWSHSLEQILRAGIRKGFDHFL